MDGLKRYVNDDRFRVDGDKNMRLLAFAFTIVFVWTGSKRCMLLFFFFFFLIETEKIETENARTQVLTCATLSIIFLYNIARVLALYKSY